MARPDGRTGGAGDDEEALRRMKTLQDAEFTCQLCGRHSHLEVHHILPRSRGGPDAKANLVTLCHNCHRDVHAGHVPLG
jgi:5-methylcytosine-specific restriction endonuclease McrA